MDNIILFKNNPIISTILMIILTLYITMIAPKLIPGSTIIFNNIFIMLIIIFIIIYLASKDIKLSLFALIAFFISIQILRNYNILFSSTVENFINTPIMSYESHPTMGPIEHEFHPTMKPIEHEFHPTMKPIEHESHPTMKPIEHNFHPTMKPIEHESHPIMLPREHEFHPTMKPIEHKFHSTIKPIEYKVYSSIDSQLYPIDESVEYELQSTITSPKSLEHNLLPTITPIEQTVYASSEFEFHPTLSPITKSISNPIIQLKESNVQPLIKNEFHPIMEPVSLPILVQVPNSKQISQPSANLTLKPISNLTENQNIIPTKKYASTFSPSQGIILSPVVVPEVCTPIDPINRSQMYAKDSINMDLHLCTNEDPTTCKNNIFNTKGYNLDIQDLYADPHFKSSNDIPIKESKCEKLNDNIYINNNIKGYNHQNNFVSI